MTLIYLLSMLLGASTDLRLIGEFFVFAFLPRTPLIVVLGVVAFLSTWSARAGIEVMGRVGQVICPLVPTAKRAGSHHRGDVQLAVAIAHLWQAVILLLMGVAVTGLLGQIQTLLYFPFFSAARLGVRFIGPLKGASPD